MELDPPSHVEKIRTRQGDRATRPAQWQVVCKQHGIVGTYDDYDDANDANLEHWQKDGYDPDEAAYQAESHGASKTWFGQ